MTRKTEKETKCHETGMIGSNGEPLTQEQVEAKAAEWGIPKAEARRMLAKKKLRGSS